MTNTVGMNNHKLEAKYVCSCAKLEAMCYMGPVGV